VGDGVGEVDSSCLHQLDDLVEVVSGVISGNGYPSFPEVPVFGLEWRSLESDTYDCAQLEPIPSFYCLDILFHGFRRT